LFANGSYTDPAQVEDVTLENDDPNDSGDYDPTNPWGTEGTQDVTFIWDKHTTTWMSDGGDLFAVINPPARVCSGYCAFFEGDTEVPPTSGDVGSLDWYLQAINVADGATYTITHTPTGDVFLVGTTVTERVTARDQHGQPIPNLFVTWFGSGPGQQNCNVSCDTSTTNAIGQASYTYAGNAQGNTVVTGVVTPADDSDNELARVVDQVGFDSEPTINAPRNRVGPGRVHITGHSRAGAEVSLFEKAFGSDHFVRIRTHMADTSGDYSFNRRISHNTRFRVGADDLIGSDIKLVRVKVKGILTVTSPRAGKVHVDLDTAPNQDSVVVKIYRVTSSGREFVEKIHTGPGGNAADTFGAKAGSHRTYVAWINHGPGNASNFSNEDGVHVKG